MLENSMVTFGVLAVHFQSPDWNIEGCCENPVNCVEWSEWEGADGFGGRMRARTWGQSAWLELLTALLAGVSALAAGSDPIAPLFAPPTEMVQEVLNAPSVTWDSTQVGQVRLYTQPGSVSHQERDSLAQAADDAVKNADQLLGLDGFPRGLRVFLLTGRDQMQAFIGHRYKGIALFSSDAALLVHNNDVRPYFRHELSHNVSLRSWGMTEAWLREGAAVAADGSCLEFTPLDVAAYLARSGQALPFRELLDHFGDHSDMITYLQSASLFLFLVENYGMGTVRSLWSEGLDSSQELFGLSLEQLEENWRAWLRGQGTTVTDADWERLLEKGCG